MRFQDYVQIVLGDVVAQVVDEGVQQLIRVNDPIVIEVVMFTQHLRTRIILGGIVGLN